MKLVYQKPSSELLDGFLIALLVTFGVCYTQGLFVMVFVLAFAIGKGKAIWPEKSPQALPI